MAKHMAHKGERSSAASKELLWRRMIRQQASSGLSVRGWCRLHEINESGFYWWRRELARRDVRNKQSAFVPVHVTDAPGQDGDPQIEIMLASGRRVRITGSVDRQMLVDVLDVLTSASSVELERGSC